MKQDNKLEDYSERNFSGTGRAELIEIIRKQAKIIKQYQTAPTLRGWWCTCDIFNDEGREPIEECKSCGLAKTDLMRIKR